MRASTRWLLAGSAAGTAAAAAAAWGLVARPWHLRWGATDDELRRAMPFDSLIGRPNYFSTRAVTIDASPQEIWPLLVDPRRLPRRTAIRYVDDHRCVVFAPPELEAEATWVVTLEPVKEGTRVVSRNRARFGRRASAVIRYLFVDPGLFVFERRWLLELKSEFA